MALSGPTGAVAVNTQIWPGGQPLHRLHNPVFGPAEFNPCQGAPSRFSPLRTADGVCVATLYGADDFDCAVYETLFHDVPFRGIKEIPATRIQSAAHSVLAPKRDLRLADLTTKGLRKLGVSRVELIESNAIDFAATVAWARAIHGQHPDLDGLYWVSRQYDRGRAVLLFGDRLGPALLDVVEGPTALAADSTLTDRVLLLAAQAGIAVSIA